MCRGLALQIPCRLAAHGFLVSGRGALRWEGTEGEGELQGCRAGEALGLLVVYLED